MPAGSSKFGCRAFAFAVLAVAGGVAGLVAPTHGARAAERLAVDAQRAASVGHVSGPVVRIDEEDRREWRRREEERRRREEFRREEERRRWEREHGRYDR